MALKGTTEMVMADAVAKRQAMEAELMSFAPAIQQAKVANPQLALAPNENNSLAGTNMIMQALGAPAQRRADAQNKAIADMNFAAKAAKESAANVQKQQNWQQEFDANKLVQESQIGSHNASGNLANYRLGLEKDKVLQNEEFTAASNKFQDTYTQYDTKEDLYKAIQKDRTLSTSEQDKIYQSLAPRWDTDYGVTDGTNAVIKNNEEAYTLGSTKAYADIDSEIDSYVRDSLGVDPAVLTLEQGDKVNVQETLDYWGSKEKAGTHAPDALKKIQSRFKGASQGLVDYIMTQAMTDSDTWGADYDLMDKDVDKAIAKYEEDKKVVTGDTIYKDLQFEVKKAKAADSTSKLKFAAKQQDLAEKNARLRGAGREDEITDVVQEYGVEAYNPANLEAIRTKLATAKLTLKEKKELQRLKLEEEAKKAAAASLATKKIDSSVLSF